MLTTALTLCIHCFLAYLLSIKGNVDVVLNQTTSQPFVFGLHCLICGSETDAYLRLPCVVMVIQCCPHVHFTRIGASHHAYEFKHNILVFQLESRKSLK